MRIQLQGPTRKLLLFGPSLLLVFTYIGFATTQFLAAYFSERADLISLQKAVRLSPGNAEYRYRIGRFLSLVSQSPAEASESYQSAVALDPHRARYWLGLATTYQILGKTANQTDALQHAIKSDPKTPDVAWQAANLYLVQGETRKAMQEFRVVLESDPDLTGPALQLCWRANPDVDSLLRETLPPVANVYSSFLNFLIFRKQPTAAAKVWTSLVQLHQPVEPQSVFEYVHYLLQEHEIARAQQVWREAATVSELSNYQASSGNLIVNGDFGLPILNAGFDWQYEQTPGVSFALDPTENHLGSRSLLISFAGQPVNDVGLRQIVPVEPNTRYDFSAYFKSPHMEGAGGTRFSVQDAYTATPFFTSDYLKNAEVWKQVAGSFTSGPDTNLVVVRVERAPLGSPLRGNLWIDGVRLLASQPGSTK